MYLDDIIQYKRREIEGLVAIGRERSKGYLDPVASLRTRPFIAEVKKASPSMGEINSGVDVVRQARLYEAGGAGAISVLTDEHFFRGDISFLSSISDNVGVPTLCKDFILSVIQVENAYRAGADMILLIAAALSREELRLLTGKARALGMTILYEIHDFEEFEKLRGLDPALVGVNARNLQTFEIDKEGAMATIRRLKGDFLKVAESGIASADDVRAFRGAGADAFLVGTALMRAEDPVGALREFAAALQGGGDVR